MLDQDDAVETVRKVSKLARLRLTENEVMEFSSQLPAVLGNFNQIANVDTTGVKPLVTPTEISMYLRPDVAEQADAEKMLQNAPEKSGRLFKVPPVV